MGNWGRVDGEGQGKQHEMKQNCSVMTPIQEMGEDLSGQGGRGYSMCSGASVDIGSQVEALSVVLAPFSTSVFCLKCDPFCPEMPLEMCLRAW